MAEGFKKYFNGTTINGRANVAKATYATLALLFIIYRMRRGSGKSSGELASGKCSCESDHQSALDGDIGVYGVDPDCSVCREKAERAMSEYDREQQRRAAEEDENGCRDDPPPPPPPSSSGGGGGGAGAAPRRKCPCEETQRRAEGAVKQSSNKVRGQQIQPPYQYHQYLQPEGEPVRPVSEVMTQVHGAIYRVLRGVYGIVMGNAAVNTSGGGGGGTAGDAQTAGVSADELEEEDERDDGQEYENGDETPLKRRTAPRSCVPTNSGQETSAGETEEAADADDQPKESAEYSAFSDGFASGLYFTSDEK
ncbi:uncharacterized protein LOC108095629 [Drosophila ficusphila]|uniref:uncharacterized protein LOC108095629 n=1 Tax=Drosophila ficusphila TaxID=30025 RepID=UPI0007E77BE2|nr:uncharacterized protein LOC108095629 [Drosophila ficusphila]